MNKVIEWFSRYKVIIIGLLVSLAQPLAELIQTGTVTPKQIVIASIGGILSFFARNLRGQWLTIVGILQLQLAPFLLDPNATISWLQIILQVIAALGFIAVPAPKSIGYERTEIIMEAKKEGEEAKPTIVPPQS